MEMEKKIAEGTVLRLTRDMSWWGDRDGVRESQKEYTKGTLFIVNDMHLMSGGSHALRIVSPLLDRGLNIPNIGYLEDGHLELL